jgi:GrpB-like predicted nucleotidyltransferase (UPF0157 family)
MNLKELIEIRYLFADMLNSENPEAESEVISLARSLDLEERQQFWTWLKAKDPILSAKLFAAAKKIQERHNSPNTNISRSPTPQTPAR